jgi:methylamine--corrinoid protein Co-methyltransferase
MALCGPMSVRGMARSEADFCTSEAAVGLMQTDSHLYSQQNDLKINIDFLRQAQHVMDLGAVAATEYLPVFGCFLLSPEAAAVADVAATLASFGMFGASWHLDGPVHVRWNNTTARETLQTAGCCAAALDRNTDLILGNQCITMAGPCTEMVLIEIAAQAVTDTVSGREVASGVRCGRGVAVDKVTGMEARLLGEACEASCRLNLPKANEVINCLLAKYEPDYKAAIQPGSPHSGKLFADCYDPIAVVPKQAYIDVYNSAKKTMMSCGLLIK